LNRAGLEHQKTDLFTAEVVGNFRCILMGGETKIGERIGHNNGKVPFDRLIDALHSPEGVPFKRCRVHEARGAFVMVWEKIIRAARVSQ